MNPGPPGKPSSSGNTFVCLPFKFWCWDSCWGFFFLIVYTLIGEFISAHVFRHSEFLFSRCLGQLWSACYQYHSWKVVTPISASFSVSGNNSHILHPTKETRVISRPHFSLLIIKFCPYHPPVALNTLPLYTSDIKYKMFLHSLTSSIPVA